MKKCVALLMAFLVCLSSCALAQDYTATATGFGGEVSVTLTIENGALTGVKAVGEKETTGIGSQAIEEMPAMMVEANSVDVDGIAGATVTSEAIKVAAAAALSEAGVELAATEQEANKMTPGVYQGSAKGFHKTLHVEVEVTEDAIVRVTVGENGETQNIGTTAFPMLEESIVANQSLADVVSGVTFSSNAVNNAVADALRAAGANNALIAKLRAAEIPSVNPGDTETDVVVVGAGAAGIVAAMNAADQGAKVILLEKEDITGGSARLSHGTIWALHQPETTVEPYYDFNADDVREFYNRQAAPISNLDVFYKVVNNTERGMNYLREHGFTVMDVEKSHAKMDDMFTAVIHEGFGPGFAAMLDKNARNRENLELRTNSPATKLVYNEDGTVGGVVVENEAGSYTIKAKKVILATGGFTYNPEMMAQYGAGYDRNNGQWTAVGATGDGHKMGLEAGGYIVGEGTLAIVSINGRPDSLFDYTNLYFCQLMVDSDGLQLGAKDEHYTTLAKKMTLENDGFAYYIHDSSLDFVIPLLEDLVAEGDVYKADTIEELADMMGIDAENFAFSVNQHNRHAFDQTNDAWGTPAETLVPIVNGPFYGVPHRSEVMGTIAGLAVNADMQVVREDGTAIENLYAVGETMFGNLFNGVYPMSGTALTVCISSGQLAADHAVSTIK